MTGPTWATRWSCTTDARCAVVISAEHRGRAGTEGFRPALLCLCLWPRWCSGCRLILLWGRAAWCARGRRPAREIATREPDGSECSISKPGQAPPPHMGAAARPRLEARPGPAAAHGRRSQAPSRSPARPRRRPRAPQPGPVSKPGQAPPPPTGDLSFVVHRVSAAHLAPSLVCLRSAMKPTAPLLALPCSGMKPQSPLRAMKGHFRANSNLQRCWRFQWGAQRGVQRCWRFQSWSVIASCARKSSPRISRSCRGARQSSPCKPITGEKRCLLVRWASFSRKNRCKLSS